VQRKSNNRVERLEKLELMEIGVSRVNPWDAVFKHENSAVEVVPYADPQPFVHPYDSSPLPVQFPWAGTKPGLALRVRASYNLPSPLGLD
jgi:hypothetical protein